MSSNLGKSALLLVAIISTVGLVTASYSIHDSEDLNHEVLSPGAESAQIVQLVDDEGVPVDSSRLDDREDLHFRYEYNGSYHSMSHLTNGYYYGMVEADTMEDNVLIQLRDSSPTSGGMINNTRELSVGELRIDILNDFSGSVEAGQDLELRADVEDLTDYYAVEVDGMTEITQDSLFILDDGGEGTYSFQSDDVLAGVTPDNAEPLTFANPWSGDQHPVAFHQSNPDNEWDSNNDAIVIDYHDGGTVSERADRVINTGSNSEVDAEEGQDLHSASDIRDSVYVVGTEIHEGVDVVYDNDSDMQYTAQPDEVLAGNAPPEGRDLMDTDSVPEEMSLSSYTPVEGTEWSEDDDLIAIDHDGDGQYTARADEVLAGITPDEAAELETENVEPWNNVDPDRDDTGNMRVYDDDSSDDWNPEVDAIWLDTGADNDGFTEGVDIPLAGNPEDGLLATESGFQFNQWESISVYHSGSNAFNQDEDAIIKDYGGGGTFSTRSDTVVAGSFSEDFEEGTEYTTLGGLESEWTLGVVQQFEGSEWDPNQDAIIRDYDEGGTYSPNADQVINHGGEVEADGGEPLTRLNAVPESDLMWVDNDGDERYTPGDELFIDRDGSGQYTSRPDRHLAGASLSGVGEGSELVTDNPWIDDQYPVGFMYEMGDSEWNSSRDSIVHDIDADGVFTARSDTVVSGDRTEASPGDELIGTDRTDFTSVDVTAFITDGNSSTATVELGRGEDGVYTNNIGVPELYDSELIVQFHAETARGEVQGSASAVMETRAQGIGFDADQSVDIQASRAGTYNENVTVENLLDVENSIHAEASEGLEDILELNEDILVDPESETDLELEFEIIPVDSYSGEIVFTENSTGEIYSTDVSVSSPSCVSGTDRFCLSQSGWMNTSVTERGNFTESFTVESIWLEEEPLTMDISADGNISDILTLSSEEVTTSETETVEIQYSVEDPGLYTGDITIFEEESVSFPVAVEADVPVLDTGFSVTPQSFDFGAIPAGSSVSETLTLENTGSLLLENFDFESGDYSIVTDDIQELEADSSTELDFTLEEPQSQQGEFTVSAVSSEDGVSGTVTVSMNLVTPEDTMTEDIRSKVSDLRTRATSPDVLDQLIEIEADINSIQTAYDTGDYEEAQELYQSAMSSLESLEVTVDANEDQQQGGQQGTDPGPDPQPGNGEGDEGGGGFLIFLILLLLVLGAGFVVYTSYYPEEGDPLYSLLGDK